MFSNSLRRILAVEPHEAAADLLDAEELDECVRRRHRPGLADGTELRLDLAVEFRLFWREFAGYVLERDRREVKDIGRPHMMRRGGDLGVGLRQVLEPYDEVPPRWHDGVVRFVERVRRTERGAFRRFDAPIDRPGVEDRMRDKRAGQPQPLRLRVCLRHLPGPAARHARRTLEPVNLVPDEEVPLRLFDPLDPPDRLVVADDDDGRGVGNRGLEQLFLRGT